MAALLIDLLLLAAIAFGLFLLLTKEFPKAGYANGIVLGHTRHAFAHGSSNRTIWVILVAATVLAIFVILPGLTGTSPGKALTRIRAVRADGRPPGVGRALLRALVWIVDGFPYLLPGLVGFIVALTSKANRRVGDMAAGTWVVRGDAAGRPISELLPAAAAAAAAAPAAATAPAAPAAGWQPPTPATAGAQQPAGWYADPHGQARLRWWDGSTWTEHVAE